jgi:hypothetical protein
MTFKFNKIRKYDLAYFNSLPLDLISPALLGRTGFEHKMINKAPRVINDDIVSTSIITGEIHTQELTWP